MLIMDLHITVVHVTKSEFDWPASHFRFWQDLAINCTTGLRIYTKVKITMITELFIDANTEQWLKSTTLLQ